VHSYSLVFTKRCRGLADRIFASATCIGCFLIGPEEAGQFGCSSPCTAWRRSICWSSSFNWPPDFGAIWNHGAGCPLWTWKAHSSFSVRFPNFVEALPIESA